MTKCWRRLSGALYDFGIFVAGVRRRFCRHQREYTHREQRLPALVASGMNVYRRDGIYCADCETWLREL